MISIKTGDKFINNKNYEYEIIKILGKGKYEIKFTDTGFTKVSDKKEILNGCIKDKYTPSVCGIGIIGTEIEHPQKHYLYDRWRDMLRRCYDPNCNMYYAYGAIGVVVDKKWYYFDNYIKDIEAKENSDKLKIRNSGWEVDKDIKGNNSKIYSNETTTIITVEENVKERNKRDGNPSMNAKLKVMRFTLEGDYVDTFESISDAVRFFNKKNGHSIIIDCCKDRGKTAFGYTWIYEKDFISFGLTKTKILKRINYKPERKLKTILKMDNEYNVIQEYYGLEEASKDLGTRISTISNAIHRENRCKGFILKYKENN